MNPGDEKAPGEALDFDRARLTSLLRRMDALWPLMKAELANSPAAALLKEADLYLQLSLWIGTADGLGSQLADSARIIGVPGDVLSRLRGGAPRRCPAIVTCYALAAEHLPATRELIDTIDLIRLVLIEVLTQHPECCVPAPDPSPAEGG
ncbi:hypothetical protein WME98_09290 [Sorangium sp. So ce296]|uniref:hypothetical protein n=1 Tax=Sorangium sp. So ce296 TaxID=3133296 RepID=UPI003F634492